jgi:hypothetical protein
MSNDQVLKFFILIVVHYEALDHKHLQIFISIFLRKNWHVLIEAVHRFYPVLTALQPICRPSVLQGRPEPRTGTMSGSLPNGLN